MAIDFTSDKYWKKMINQGLIRFFLLKVLYEDKESYGYKIVERISELSDGICNPTESTIYPALKELMNGKYLDCHSVSNGKKIRKVYSLNLKGKSAYRAAAKAYGEIIPTLRKSILL